MLYPLLRAAHNALGYTGLYVGALLFVLATIIGVVQRRDVTALFRRTVVFIAATVVLQAVIGAYLWLGVGARPAAEVHWIYGLGAALALPYFVFIEVTAEKRPAMGNYIWGFGLLTAVLLRAIGTG